MKLSLKNGFFGYFKYFYSIIGSKLLLLLGLSIIVSFLDGMGLAMFIPLLKAVGDGQTQQSAANNAESLG
ncbi:MAG TPA: ABC transporter ATP-binding protein, partial [Niastella sp.]